MDTHKLPNASEVSETDLTDSKYWKPIYEEIMRIMEQRELLKASARSIGVK